MYMTFVINNSALTDWRTTRFKTGTLKAGGHFVDKMSDINN